MSSHEYTTNPLTGRQILIGGPTYKKLIACDRCIVNPDGSLRLVEEGKPLPPSPREISPNEEFLDKYKLRGKYTCYPYSPFLEQSHGPVINCLPEKEIKTYLAQLDGYMKTPPFSRNKDLLHFYELYKNYINNELFKEHIKFKGEFISPLNGDKYYEIIMKSIPLVHTIYRILVRTRGADNVIKALLSCKDIRDPSFEYIPAKWYLGVVINAINYLTINGMKIDQSIIAAVEEMYYYCSLP
jgi:hypothetical protein